MRRLLPVVTVFLPVIALYLAGSLEFVERRWMDARFALTPREATSNIVLVDIDPHSLSALNVWPWPRGYHATVLEQLLDAGAARVGFDVEFSSRSIAEEDVELANAIRAAAGRVVLPVFHQWQRSAEGSYLTAVEPLPELRGDAPLGSINVDPETDGLVRRYRTHRKIADTVHPSFVVALSGRTAGVPRHFYIDYGVSASSIPRLSYVDVLLGQFDPKSIRGRAVIIGSTAVELGDQIAVPVSAALPGPIVQALAYESFTRDRALWRVDRATIAAVCLLLVLLLAPLYQKAPWRRGLMMALASVGVVLASSVVILTKWPLLVDTAPLWLTSVGTYGFTLVRRIDQQNVGLLMQRLKLRRTEHLMRHVVENSFDAIVTVDDRNRIQTFNPSAQRLFGYEIDDIAGVSADCLLPPLAVGAECPLGGADGKPIESLARRRDGSTFPVELIVTHIDTGETRHRVAFLRDITERKHQQLALEHQATHDPLTNLPNRTLLRDRLRSELKSFDGDGPASAVLLLDLDRFKEINDALGHHTGDILLQKVARRLEAPLDRDAMLARLGGDEFAILIPHCDQERARETAVQLAQALRAPFVIDGMSLQIDTSIGITLFPEHGRDAPTLLRHADVAMYVAKRRRIGFAVYDPEEDMNSLRHLTLRADLRRAIEEEQLSLVFQPKVLAAGNRIVGVEVLARWNHPELGTIPPDEFISLAEHGGLIQPLTEFVCRTALKHGSEWAREGIHLNIAVNLSARNLLEEDLPEVLGRLLASCRVSAKQLTLEITESVIMEDPDRALRVVTRLRELGLGISIDDFGTGYSSLGYLMKLPAQELKIDKSFVMQMETDPGHAMIVHSTIDLAHNLGLKVVAEGVESRTIWQVLRELGVDYGQGYYFSRPLTAEQLLELLKAGGNQAAEWAPPPEPPARIDPLLLPEMAEPMHSPVGDEAPSPEGEVSFQRTGVPVPSINAT